jgi:hypothetical protein
LAPDIGAEEKEFMKAKTKYTNEPLGRVPIIEDFLPPPLACWLPTFGSQRLSRGHLLAAVAFWIIGSQALFQGKPRIINPRDDDLIAFNRYAHALIDMQVRFPRHRSRQANTQIITPLFDIQNRFYHDNTPLHKRINASLYILRGSVNFDVSIETLLGTRRSSLNRSDSLPLVTRGAGVEG